MNRIPNTRPPISAMDPIRATGALVIIVVLLGVLGTVDRVLAYNNLPRLVAKLKPAVLLLYSHASNGRSMSQGTGFFITKNGLFVTNYHFMGTLMRNKDKRARLEAVTSDGHHYPVIPGTLVESLDADLVVGHVDLPAGVLSPYLKLAKKRPELGESILTIGNPLGQGWTVAEGIISGHRRVHQKYSALNEYKNGDFDQFSAPFTHGASGSPVMNMRGEVVCVATYMVPSVEGAHAQLHYCSIAQNILALKLRNGTTIRDLVDKVYVSDASVAYKKRMAEANTDTQRAYATNLLGVDYSSIGDDKNARNYFIKALEYDPNFAASHYNLGAMYHRQKDWNSYFHEYQILVNMDKRRAARLKALGVPKDLDKGYAAGQFTLHATSGNQSASSGVLLNKSAQ